MVRYKENQGIKSAQLLQLPRQSPISQAIQSNAQRYAHQPPQLPQIPTFPSLQSPPQQPYAYKSKTGVIFGKSSTGSTYAYQAAPNESPPHPHASTPIHGLFKTVQDNGDHMFTTNRRNETFVLTKGNSPIRTNDTLLSNGQCVQPKPIFKKNNIHKPSRKNGYARYPKSSNNNKRRYPKKQKYRQHLHQQRNKAKSHGKQRRFNQNSKVKYT